MLARDLYQKMYNKNETDQGTKIIDEKNLAKDNNGSLVWKFEKS